MQDATNFNPIARNYVKDQVFVDDKYAMSGFLDRFILRYNTQLGMEREHGDSVLHGLIELLGGGGISLFDKCQDFSKIILGDR